MPREQVKRPVQEPGRILDSDSKVRNIISFCHCNTNPGKLVDRLKQEKDQDNY